MSLAFPLLLCRMGIVVHLGQRYCLAMKRLWHPEIPVVELSAVQKSLWLVISMSNILVPLDRATFGNLRSRGLQFCCQPADLA